jgi:dipeptidyl aminopeptidase/acylaminoacyl peptidase
VLQRVSFPVAGTEVEGILHLPDGETIGGVIEMGGGVIEHGAFVCEALAAAGVAALRFAFRVRPSGGRTVDADAGLADAAAAVRLLRAHPMVPQRIGAVGHSFGGIVAARVAGRDSRIRAAALLAAPAERPELGGIRPTAEISRTRARVLLCYGSADERVPPSEGERYARVLSQARVTHRLVVIDGADHFFSAPSHRAQMLEALTEWTRTSLAT